MCVNDKGKNGWQNYLSGSGPSHHVHNLSHGGPAHDGIVHQKDILAGEHSRHGIELALHAELASPLHVSSRASQTALLSPCTMLCILRLTGAFGIGWHAQCQDLDNAAADDRLATTWGMHGAQLSAVYKICRQPLYDIYVCILYRVICIGKAETDKNCHFQEMKIRMIGIPAEKNRTDAMHMTLYDVTWASSMIVTNITRIVSFLQTVSQYLDSTISWGSSIQLLHWTTAILLKPTGRSCTSYSDTTPRWVQGMPKMAKMVGKSPDPEVHAAFADATGRLADKLRQKIDYTHPSANHAMCVDYLWLMEVRVYLLSELVCEAVGGVCTCCAYFWVWRFPHQNPAHGPGLA